MLLQPMQGDTGCWLDVYQGPAAAGANCVRLPLWDLAVVLRGARL